MQNKQPSVRDLEARWVRVAWWVLPLLLAVLFPLIKGYAWPMIGLDPAMPPSLSLRSMIVFATVGLCAGLGLAALWAWSVRSGEGCCTSWRWSVVLALILIIVADIVARNPVVQDALWGAVQVRCVQDDDYFMRTVAMFRRTTLHTARADPRPTVKLVGSSQLLWGVDVTKLQAAIPFARIERYAIASLFPVRILQAQAYLNLKSNDLVVVYWSELDMATVRDLDVAKWRPVANVAGFKATFALFPGGILLREWRSMVDYVVATQSALWRDREAMGMLALRPLGVRTEVETELTTNVLFRVGDGFRKALQDDETIRRGLAASERLVADWTARGVRVMILEGHVSSYMDQPETQNVRQRVRDRLRELSAVHPEAMYISAEQQAWVPATTNWRDTTHLNKIGREKFTEYLASELKECISIKRGL